MKGIKLKKKHTRNIIMGSLFVDLAVEMVELSPILSNVWSLGVLFAYLVGVPVVMFREILSKLSEVG